MSVPAPRLMQVLSGPTLVGQLVFERYDSARDHWVCTKATQKLQHLVGLDADNVSARFKQQRMDMIPTISSADSGSAPGAVTHPAGQKSPPALHDSGNTYHRPEGLTGTNPEGMGNPSPRKHMQPPTGGRGNASAARLKP